MVRICNKIKCIVESSILLQGLIKVDTKKYVSTKYFCNKTEQVLQISIGEENVLYLAIYLVVKLIK